MGFQQIGWQFLFIAATAFTAILVSRFVRNSRFSLDLKGCKRRNRFLDVVPSMVWAEVEGSVIWSNKAHIAMQKKLEVDISKDSFKCSAKLPSTEPQIRATLQGKEKDAAIYSFDLSTYCFEGADYYIAISAQAAVDAERDRKRFLQTLSEIFAHMPIGVALFDKERDLSLFNPALCKLLGACPNWLAREPSLREFLDCLHDKGALPEPRDFKTWRDKIIDMEKSAVNGSYHDDWHLPNDTIIRVVGRPHPEGAVAFMFEDITQQVSSEREFRFELDRLYSGYDFLDCAIVMFDAAGHMTFANSSFDELWKTEISESLVSPAIADLTDVWSAKTRPSPVWGEIRDFSSSLQERTSWSTMVKHKDGQDLRVNVNPLPNGFTMIQFSRAAST